MLDTKKKRLITLLLIVGSALPVLLAQRRGGPPRRIADPQTIELEGGSRVEFKSMNSEAVGNEVNYSVFLPPSYRSDPDRRYPVIYFLHGLFNDHTSWAVERYGNLPSLIDAAMKEKRIPEFLMIHPGAGNNFYTDGRNGGPQFEKLVSGDLVRHVEKTYRVKSERRSRAIAGTSMGGYGALKLAMKHPELFSRVAAGSPIILMGDDPLASIPDSEGRFAGFITQLIGNVFGNPVDKTHWKDNSVAELARTRSFDNVDIFFFYGTADRYGQLLPLEKGVRRLDEILSERGIDHNLKIVENGPHGWELVRDNFEEMISFLTSDF